MYLMNFQMLKPWTARDGAQHHEDEDQAGCVESSHQLAERHQAVHAVRAYGEGHGAESAYGRHLHDEADDGEQHVRGLLDEVEHQRAAPAEAVQREAEHHRDQQHLQDFALGEGVHHGGRDDVQDEVGRADHLPGAGIGRDSLGVQRGDVDIHALRPA